MSRRDHHHHHYYRQDDHYYAAGWMEWMMGLVIFGCCVVIIISYFIFDTDSKAKLANAEATKNYEKIMPLAVRNCNLEVMKFLMERNLVDIHGTLGFGRKLLGYAAEKECLEGIQFLIEQKVDINSTSVIESDKGTVLHYAAQQGNLEFVKFLLRNGANPNAKEYKRRKPRDLAVMMLRHNENNKPYREIIDLLTQAEKQYKSEQ